MRVINSDRARIALFVSKLSRRRSSIVVRQATNASHRSCSVEVDEEVVEEVVEEDASALPFVSPSPPPFVAVAVAPPPSLAHFLICKKNFVVVVVVVVEKSREKVEEREKEDP